MTNSEPEAWRGQNRVCDALFPLAWRMSSTSPVECEFIVRQELVAGSLLAGWLSWWSQSVRHPGNGQGWGRE